MAEIIAQYRSATVLALGWNGLRGVEEPASETGSGSSPPRFPPEASRSRAPSLAMRLPVLHDSLRSELPTGGSVERNLRFVFDGC